MSGVLLPDRRIQGTPALQEPFSLHPPATPMVLFFFALSVVYWVFHYLEFANMWQGDLQVYAQALRSWQAGVNPYDASMAPLYFLYPPAFLYLAGFLSHLVPAHWGGWVYTALHVAATCAIPLVLARYFFRQTWLNAQFALLLFLASPLFTGLRALCSLNIASTAYCLAFVAAIPGLRRNRWWWFYAVVFMAAAIKFTFLILLLLPLMVGKRQWIKSIGCVVTVAGANLLEMVFLPRLYAGYRWSLIQGVVNEQSYGYGIFGVVAAYGYKLNIPVPAGAYVVAISLAVVLVGLLLLLRKRLEKLGQMSQAGDLGGNGIWLAMVVTTIILANPRELQYDADISFFAAYVLWVYGLQTRRLLLLMVILFLPSLLMPMLIKALHLHGMYGTFGSLAAFGLSYWRLWPKAGQSGNVTPIRSGEYPSRTLLSSMTGN